MLEAVIFDMDGVILNSEAIYVEEGRELFKTLGISVSPEEHYSYVGGTTVDMWTKIKKNHKLDDYTVEELCKMQIGRFKKRLIEEKNLKISEGLVDLIKDLKSHNAKIAIASSSPRSIVDIITKKLNIYEYFDLLVSGELVEKGKPEPDIFLKTAELLGAFLDKTIVIEDSRNGITAANRANIKSVAYKKYAMSEESIPKNADLTIDDFHEIDYDVLDNLLKK